MLALYLGTNTTEFKEKYKNAILNYYKEDTEIISEAKDSFIFKIPFAPDFYARVRFNNTVLTIGKKENINGDDIDTDPLFNKQNPYTEFTYLILKDNSITLFTEDPRTLYGGSSIYSIIKTYDGPVVLGLAERPGEIRECRSVCLESGEELTPVTFGNQVISNQNQLLQQYLNLTNESGKIYTALDIHNISYKSVEAISTPNLFISGTGLASKTKPKEPIKTSLAIYKNGDVYNREG